MNKTSKKNNNGCCGVLCIATLMIVFVILIGTLLTVSDYFGEVEHHSDSPAHQAAWNQVSEFATENHLSVDDWPDEIVELLASNPEAKEFVLNYPLLKDSVPDIDLSAYQNSDNVPLFLQWDQRWGYHKYGKEVMGLSGCGPTCLSMVCLYVLNDTEITPKYVAEFAQKNGYYVPGSGSSWTLISEGGKKLGLDIEELPLDNNIVFRNLKEGIPIICAMGPGDFTTTGHFVVMIGCEDGKIKINDPNSISRSECLWEFDDISNQIRNLWSCKPVGA